MPPHFARILVSEETGKKTGSVSCSVFEVQHASGARMSFSSRMFGLSFCLSRFIRFVLFVLSLFIVLLAFFGCVVCADFVCFI